MLFPEDPHPNKPPNVRILLGSYLPCSFSAGRSHFLGLTLIFGAPCLFSSVRSHFPWFTLVFDRPRSFSVRTYFSFLIVRIFLERAHVRHAPTATLKNIERYQISKPNIGTRAHMLLSCAPDAWGWAQNLRERVFGAPEQRARAAVRGPAQRGLGPKWYASEGSGSLSLLLLIRMRKGPEGVC